MRSWEEIQKEHKNKTKKNVEELKGLCPLLLEHGICLVVIEYNGSGDEGSIEDICFKGEGGVDMRLPDALQAKKYPSRWKPEEEEGLQDHIEELAYSLLPGGWETNEGSLGEVKLNTKTGELVVDHNWRIEETKNELFTFS